MGEYDYRVVRRSDVSCVLGYDLAGLEKVLLRNVQKRLGRYGFGIVMLYPSELVESLS